MIQIIISFNVKYFNSLEIPFPLIELGYHFILRKARIGSSNRSTKLFRLFTFIY